MKWLGYFAFFAFLSSAPLSGQALPSLPPTPTPSTPKSNLLETGTLLATDSQTLVQRLEERKRQAIAQVESWESIIASLKSEIAQGKLDSRTLSDKLAKAEAELASLRAELKEISRLLDLSRSDASALQTDFDNYKKAQALELWITRGVAVIGIAAAIYGLSRAAH